MTGEGTYKHMPSSRNQASRSRSSRQLWNSGDLVLNHFRRRDRWRELAFRESDVGFGSDCDDEMFAARERERERA